jgi:hypothetical protein
LKAASGPAGTGSTAPPIGTSQGSSRMDQMKSALNEAIALVKNPVGYMTQNKDATIPVNTLIINYVAILALIPLVGRILGDLLFYQGAGLGGSIVGSIVAYIVDIIEVFVVGYIIAAVAPSFNSNKDQRKAMMLSAYIFTPVFLVGILSIIPFLGLLAILGLLYGLYIFYLGLPIVLNTPKDKTIVYVIVVFVIGVIIEYVISAILSFR